MHRHLIYTTLLTCVDRQHLIRRNARASLSYLEESLQPPHLKDALSNQNSQLENRPPLDSSICALCSISVCPFPHDYVRLLILDLRKKLGELPNCIFVSCCEERRTGLADLLLRVDRTVHLILERRQCHAH